MPISRLLLAPTLAVILLGAMAGTAPAKRVVDSYCSPTGDYCTGVFREGARIKLEIVTLSFRGSYKLCVKPPNQPRECRSFNLVRRKGAWGSKIDFARSFSHRRSGRYAVSWRYKKFQLGRSLHFSK